jgi:hypothetical protein
LLLPIIFCIQTVYFDSFINLSFTGVTSRAGTAYPIRAPEFDTVLWWVRLTQSLIFCVVRPCFWWVRLAQSLGGTTQNIKDWARRTHQKQGRTTQNIKDWARRTHQKQGRTTQNIKDWVRRTHQKTVSNSGALNG